MDLEEYQDSAMKEESSGTNTETGMEDKVLCAYYENNRCDCGQEMMDLVELSFCVCVCVFQEMVNLAVISDQSAVVIKKEVVYILHSIQSLYTC